MNPVFRSSLKVLETERLILRPMTEEDALTVVNWRNSEHVASMSINTANKKITVVEHLSWFFKSRAERIDYIVEAKNSCLPIGSFSFTSRELAVCKNCAELGKYIGEKSEVGKGYATEAAHKWIQYGFEEINLDCIIARTRRDNISNIKINQKIGFTLAPLPEMWESSASVWIFMQLFRSDWTADINQLNKGKKCN